MIDSDLILFFGKCGNGKTSLMVHMADEYVREQGAMRWEWTEQMIREENGRRKTALEYPRNIPIYANKCLQLTFTDKAGREVKPIIVEGRDMGVNIPEDSRKYKYFYPASLFMLDEAQREFASKSEHLPKGQLTFFQERRHAQMKIMLAAPRAVAVHKDIRDSGVYGVEVRGMRNERSRFGTLTASRWYCREFTDKDDLELYITTNGREGEYIRTTYEHRGNIFELYDSFANRKDFMPPEGEEFLK